jgi:hypothetical protein
MLRLLRFAAACLPLVLATTAAAAPGVLKLRFPSVTAAAGAASEACIFIPLSSTEPFDMAGWQIIARAPGLAVQHVIVYVYQGERLADFARDAEHVVFSRGCLDLGPDDRDRRQMIAAVTTATGAGAFPPGVALRLSPVPDSPGDTPAGFGFLIDFNWTNATDRPRRASARVLLRRAKAGSVRRLAQPFADRSATLGLHVAPNTVGTTETSTAALNAARPGEPPVRDAWAPATDACVTTLVPQMHKRALFFGADVLDANGQTRNPSPGAPNPFEPGRTHLYAALDYTDPGLAAFFPPQLVRAGESLHYHCRYDNGAARLLRLGCEETAGVAPGIAAGLSDGHPAKPCRTPGAASPDCPAADPAYPGRSFTGMCMPANLVAGSSPDDEVCGILGSYFDAVPGAPAGSECNVSSLPPLS